MLNEFLTHMLQVIIVLDVVGLVAYFVLRARRSRDEEIASAAPSAPAMSRAAPSLWTKLTRSGRPQPVHARPAPSMDGALSQLRRVLDSYRSSIA